MISKSLRIGRGPLVEYLMRKGRRIHGRFLSLKIIPSKDLHHRFCVVVSKKTLPHAVDRNRVRRRTYAALAYALNLHPLTKTCYDIAVVCSAAARDIAFDALRSEIIDHIKRLSL